MRSLNIDKLILKKIWEKINDLIWDFIRQNGFYAI